jgi:hypothetical protein
MSFGSDECPECLSTSRNNKRIAQAHYLMKNYRRLAIHEMAEEVGIFCGSCHAILMEDLGIRHVYKFHNC